MADSEREPQLRDTPAFKEALALIDDETAKRLALEELNEEYNDPDTPELLTANEYHDLQERRQKAIHAHSDALAAFADAAPDLLRSIVANNA